MGLINDLYDDAEKMRNDYNFNAREHSRDNLKSARNIIENLEEVIQKISKNLNET